MGEILRCHFCGSSIDPTEAVWALVPHTYKDKEEHKTKTVDEIMDTPPDSEGMVVVASSEVVYRTGMRHVPFHPEHAPPDRSASQPQR